MQRTTAAKALPLLDPLQTPTQHPRARSVDNTPLAVRSFTPAAPLPSVTSSSRIQNTSPTSVTSSSRLQPPAPTMTTKINILVLLGMLNAAVITAWLATCEDTFEAWDLLNPTRPLGAQPLHSPCRFEVGVPCRGSVVVRKPRDFEEIGFLGGICDGG